jgi:hypothetical protein
MGSIKRGPRRRFPQTVVTQRGPSRGSPKDCLPEMFHRGVLHFGSNSGNPSETVTNWASFGGCPHGEPDRVPPAGVPPVGSLMGSHKCGYLRPSPREVQHAKSTIRGPPRGAHRGIPRVDSQAGAPGVRTQGGPPQVGSRNGCPEGGKPNGVPQGGPQGGPPSGDNKRVPQGGIPQVGFNKFVPPRLVPEGGSNNRCQPTSVLHHRTPRVGHQIGSPSGVLQCFPPRVSIKGGSPKGGPEGVSPMGSPNVGPPRVSLKRCIIRGFPQEGSCPRGAPKGVPSREFHKGAAKVCPTRGSRKWRPPTEVPQGWSPKGFPQRVHECVPQGVPQWLSNKECQQSIFPKGGSTGVFEKKRWLPSVS